MTSVEAKTSRRSFWAWCLESEEPTAEQRADLARTLSERAGTAITPQPVPESGRRRAARAPHRRARRAGAVVHDRHVERAFHAHGAHLTDRTRAFHLDFPNPPDVVAHPRDRGRAGGDARLVRDGRPRGGALRRRLVGGVGREPARGRRRRHDRPRPPRPGAGDRRRVAGGPHPGRRARPAPRGPAAPARLHAAPLPPVVPVLVARRLDRHPLGRPLRHQPHPHRRLRRVGAGADAAGLVGVAPPARLGRRAVARPDDDRQRGHPRHHHVGVDARAAPARLPGHGRRHVRQLGRRLRRPCATSCRPSCGRPTSASSTRPRRSGPPGSTARRRS